MLDLKKIREDFPILSEEVYGKPLVYFDNGATTQKPKQVIDKIAEYYLKYNSNIHRGVHFLSNKCTDANEEARETVRAFINARKTSEVIFTRGTTESINLIVNTWGEQNIKEGDEVIVSEMEHHSNMVPWQMLCGRKKAKLVKLPFDDKGDISMEELKGLINSRTKVVCITHVSNALGTVNPIKEITEYAHSKGVVVAVDGAQAVPHTLVDVQALDCDFFAFSGHKIYAPTGVGVLYGKEDILDKMVPWQGGGEMIGEVSFEKTTFNVLPFKFEAGTPNYVGNIALGEAIKYVESIGIEEIAAYEKELLNYATDKLSSIDGLEIYGKSAHKASLISFLVKDIHHYDMGTLLDKMGIAVRTGTHCAEPVMQHYGISGTVRASFSFYNTKEEIDKLAAGIEKICKIFRR